MIRKIIKLSAPIAVCGVLLSGCGGANQYAQSPEEARDEARSYNAAAIDRAESNIALAPSDGGYWAQLGRAYMRGGRFESSARAYATAASLDYTESRAMVSNILMAIAVGEDARAKTAIQQYGEGLDPADVGLAMALVGDHDQALSVLGYAAQQSDAGPRTRQNLALALAMSGRWMQARAVVAQDISPAEVDQRIEDWAVLIGYADPAERIAKLLGVERRYDPGLPGELSTYSTASPPDMSAMDDSVTDSAVAESEVEESVYSAPSADMPQMAAMQEPYVQESAPAALQGWLVQVGSYSRMDSAESQWQRLQSKYTRIAGSGVIDSTVVDGKRFYRLSISDFPSRESAETLCASLKADQQNCFIREATTATDIRWRDSQ